MSALLESRSFRPFKSSEEYLYAMKEDLAEWLSGLYPDLYINVMNFMDRLDTGVALCKHANSVRKYAEEWVRAGKKGGAGAEQASRVLSVAGVRYLPGAKPGTFFARDNVSNFISWCRKGLGVIECLLFETDDLIMRKNEKHVILCLLEVARRGARLGMPAPMLVQLEQEIDREIAADARHLKRANSQHLSAGELIDDDDDDDDDDDHQFGPLPQIVTNDLKSLDEMVRDLVEKCTCPTQFPMIRVSEGKYRIGDTKVLIFVRVLRSHVMVRVGGGWDTLAHYLDKHDPCRCKTAHRAPVSTKVVGMRMGGPAVELTHAQVHYDRSPPRTRRSSASSIGSNRGRSVSPVPNKATATLSPHAATVTSHRSRSRSRSPTPTPTPNTLRPTHTGSRSRSPTPRRASSANRSRSTTPMRPAATASAAAAVVAAPSPPPPPAAQAAAAGKAKDSLKEELLKQISAKQKSEPVDVEALVEQYQPLPTIIPTDSGVDTSPAHKVSDNFTSIAKITINPPPLSNSPTHTNQISSGVDTTPSRKISENFHVADHSRKSIKYGSINTLDSFEANNDSGSEVSDEGYRSLGVVNSSTPGSNAITTPQGSPVRLARVSRSRSLGGSESPPPATTSSSPFRRLTPATRSARPSAAQQPTFCQQVAEIMQQYAAIMPTPRKDSKPDSAITRIPAPVPAPKT